MPKLWRTGLLNWRRKQSDFRGRSRERDAALDDVRNGAIVAAFGKAISEAESERDGLQRRMDDAMLRAAATIGNDADEYLSRDHSSDQHQTNLNAEIRYSESRLTALALMIETYKTSQTFFCTAARFPFR